MRKKTGKKRTIYSPEFKEQAIKLAQELGSAREACEKAWYKSIFKPSDCGFAKLKPKQKPPLTMNFKGSGKRIKNSGKSWKKKARVSFS